MAGLVAVVAGGLGIAWRLYDQYGDPVYDANVSRITEFTDMYVIVEFVTVVPSGGGAACTVRARGVGGEEIGRARVPVQAAPGRTRATTVYRLETRGPARAVDVVGCGPAESR